MGHRTMPPKHATGTRPRFQGLNFGEKLEKGEFSDKEGMVNSRAPVYNLSLSRGGPLRGQRVRGQSSLEA